MIVKECLIQWEQYICKHFFVKVAWAWFLALFYCLRFYCLAKRLHIVLKQLADIGQKIKTCSYPGVNVHSFGA